MRIHDINVVADPSTGVPEGHQYDGTSDGIGEELTSHPDVYTWLDAAEDILQDILSWWEGIWPRLYLYLTFLTPSGGTALLHYSVDLIGDLRVEATDFSSPIADQLTLSQRDAWAMQIGQQASQPGELEDWFRGWTEAVLLIINTACALVASVFAIGGIPAVAELMFFAHALWISWLSSLLGGLFFEVISEGFILGILMSWLEVFFSPTGLIVTSFLKSAILYYVIMRMWSSMRNLAYWKTWAIWTVIGVLEQFYMYVYTYFLFVILLEMSIENYLESG